jgi:hypothetical protein
MNNEAKLGTIPTGTEGRDAVHVAIVPCQAGESLSRGVTVELNKHGHAIQCGATDAIGIVDPFRSNNDRNLMKGDWFWLCLYPKTITGLRHVWEHPGFPPSVKTEAESESKRRTDKQIAEEWLRVYVREHCPYDDESIAYSEFMNHVVKHQEIYYHGSDLHCLENLDKPEELFRNLSIVLDRKIDEAYFDGNYSCSC